MDSDKKEKLNDAIAIVREVCDEYFSECAGCPLYKHICNGLGGYQRAPYNWHDIEVIDNG